MTPPWHFSLATGEDEKLQRNKHENPQVLDTPSMEGGVFSPMELVLFMKNLPRLQLR